jgi:hypothetical protein
MVYGRVQALTAPTSRCDEISRRLGLRSPGPRGRVGANPSTGTTYVVLAEQQTQKS